MLVSRELVLPVVVGLGNCGVFFPPTGSDFVVGAAFDTAGLTVEVGAFLGAKDDIVFVTVCFFFPEVDVEVLFGIAFVESWGLLAGEGAGRTGLLAASDLLLASLSS